MSLPSRGAFLERSRHSRWHNPYSILLQCLPQTLSPSSAAGLSLLSRTNLPLTNSKSEHLPTVLTLSLQTTPALSFRRLTSSLAVNTIVSAICTIINVEGLTWGFSYRQAPNPVREATFKWRSLGSRYRLANFWQPCCHCWSLCFWSYLQLRQSCQDPCLYRLWWQRVHWKVRRSVSKGCQDSHYQGVDYQRYQSR